MAVEVREKRPPTVCSADLSLGTCTEPCKKAHLMGGCESLKLFSTSWGLRFLPSSILALPSFSNFLLCPSSNSDSLPSCRHPPYCFPGVAVSELPSKQPQLGTAAALGPWITLIERKGVRWITGVFQIGKSRCLA